MGGLVGLIAKVLWKVETLLVCFVCLILALLVCSWQNLKILFMKTKTFFRLWFTRTSLWSGDQWKWLVHKALLVPVDKLTVFSTLCKGTAYLIKLIKAKEISLIIVGKCWVYWFLNKYISTCCHLIPHEFVFRFCLF